MKGFWITMLAITILVSNFFIILLSMASCNNRSIADEWKSWMQAEEETVDVDTEIREEVEVTTPGEVVPE